MNKIFTLKNIPNFITIIRLVLVIVIIILLILASGGHRSDFFDYYYVFSINQGNYLIYWLIAAILFLIAAGSDFLDGYLARKYNWTTVFGKFMDPLVDKVLINITGLILTIFYSQMFPFWILIIFFMRDYLLDGIRLVIVKEYNIVLAANFWGKLKTITQMLAIIFIFFLLPFFGANFIAQQLILIPLYLSALISIISLANYIFSISMQINGLCNNAHQ